MDLLIEIIFEIFVEGYVELMTALIPEKIFKPKTYLIIKVLCAAVSAICLLALFIGVGCMLGTDPHERLVGRYIFFIALAVAVIQVIIGIIGRIKSKNTKKDAE